MYANTIEPLGTIASGSSTADALLTTSSPRLPRTTLLRSRRLIFYPCRTGVRENLTADLFAAFNRNAILVAMYLYPVKPCYFIPHEREAATRGP